MYYGSSLAAELPESVFAEKFTLAFQPQYNVASGAMQKMEALLRSRNNNSNQAPHQEITLAERDGTIHQLGLWIIEQTLLHFDSLHELYAIERVAVNVSPVQIMNHEFAEGLEAVMSRFPDMGHRLELEITEKFPLNHSAQVIENINRAKDLGIRVVLDDFGTGYTSLPLLAEMPIDGIKLDKLFCQNLDNPKYVEIAKNLIQLGKSLGITTVMEGVETKKQFQKVTSMLCPVIQGNYLEAAKKVEHIITI